MLCYPCLVRLPISNERCFSCLGLSPHGLTCRQCITQVSLRSVRSATQYSDVAKRLIHALKFERSRHAVAPIAQLVSSRLPIQSNVLLTFVPTATNRVRTRGYDQSLCLARAIAKESNQSVYRLLARRTNARQVGATRDVRRDQQYEAFRVINPAFINNKRILIFDDVITTGSTLDACAKELITAGANQVDALTFAQA